MQNNTPKIFGKKIADLGKKENKRNFGIKVNSQGDESKKKQVEVNLQWWKKTHYKHSFLPVSAMSRQH